MLFLRVFDWFLLITSCSLTRASVSKMDSIAWIRPLTFSERSHSSSTIRTNGAFSLEGGGVSTSAGGGRLPDHDRPSWLASLAVSTTDDIMLALSELCARSSSVVSLLSSSIIGRAVNLSRGVGDDGSVIAGDDIVRVFGLHGLLIVSGLMGSSTVKPLLKGHNVPS